MADRPSLLDDTLGRFGAHGTLTDLLSRALVAEPPVDSSAGGFIAQGYDAALDELRSTAGDGRSEEHTSELQSLMRISYAVFCLKNKKKHIHIGQAHHDTHTVTTHHVNLYHIHKQNHKQ